MPNSQDIRVAGHCYCGAIRFSVSMSTGDKVRFALYCHCDSCRRAHAAPLYHVVCLPAAHLSFDEGEELLREFQRPGKKIVRAFCERCGSKVLNRFPEWRPEGKELVAFFPALLEEETQKNLPSIFRPTGHNRPEEHVLHEAVLREFFEAHPALSD